MHLRDPSNFLLAQLFLSFCFPFSYRIESSFLNLCTALPITHSFEHSAVSNQNYSLYFNSFRHHHVTFVYIHLQVWLFWLSKLSHIVLFILFSWFHKFCMFYMPGCYHLKGVIGLFRSFLANVHIQRNSLHTRDQDCWPLLLLYHVTTPQYGSLPIYCYDFSMKWDLH